VSVPRLVGLGAIALTCLGLYLFFTRTDLGRAVRATGQDREAARLMGINNFRIYGIAYALSAALMGVAAAVLVPFSYVHPGVGMSFLLKVFVIVVLGAIGSMPGAAVGGILVGMVEGIVALWVQAAVAQIVLFGVFVAQRGLGRGLGVAAVVFARVVPLLTRHLIGDDEGAAAAFGVNVSRARHTAAREITSVDTRRSSQRPAVELPTSLPWSTTTWPRRMVVTG